MKLRVNCLSNQIKMFSFTHAWDSRDQNNSIDIERKLFITFFFFLSICVLYTFGGVVKGESFSNLLLYINTFDMDVKVHCILKIDITKY